MDFRVIAQLGRQFSNQLFLSDIAYICPITLLDNGGFVCSPLSHTDGAKNSFVRLRASGDCDHAGEETILQVVVAQTSGVLFLIPNLKMEGIMTPCKFECLETHISGEAVKIMNETKL